MRNRLLFRSTPCALRRFVTSVKLDVFASMKYLDVLFLYASRAMMKSEFGIASKSSPSCWMSRKEARGGREGSTS
eukprot:31414-Pelagococcus_subviridis.AAC.5